MGLMLVLENANVGASLVSSPISRDISSASCTTIEELVKLEDSYEPISSHTLT
jgi:hypothetical protein